MRSELTQLKGQIERKDKKMKMKRENKRSGEEERVT